MILQKIPYPHAKDIVEIYTPSDEIKELVSDTISPIELIQQSMSQELYSDTITFISHSLPIREAIWWAVCCASVRTDWNEEEMNAVRAAKAWVHAPDETSRRHAEKMADLSGLDTGAGWAAMSAFWSGGSMTKADDPVAPPPPYLYAQAVAGCINLTAVLPDGEQAEKRYAQFIEFGLNIASGGNGQN